MARALHLLCPQPCLASEHRCREDGSGAGSSAWGMDHTGIATCHKSEGDSAPAVVCIPQPSRTSCLQSQPPSLPAAAFFQALQGCSLAFASAVLSIFLKIPAFLHPCALCNPPTMDHPPKTPLANPPPPPEGDEPRARRTARTHLAARGARRGLVFGFHS